MAACVALGGCSSVETLGSKIDPIYGVSASPRVVAEGEPVPRGGGSYKVGKPYTVAGRTYVPAENPNYVAEGTASWYGKDFHGRKTANGEIFDMTSVTAAHKTLPMPSYVRVTNLSNSRSIVVRVNNRGPYVGDRLIDLSYRTAELLGFAGNGVAKVRVEYLGRAPLDGSDDRKLAMTLRQDGKPADLFEDSPVRVASARPFVPDVPAVRTVAASTPPSDEAPLPPGRPFDLGQPAADTGGSVSVASAGWSSGPAPVSGLGFAGVPGAGAR
ncbi:septal ring lytic transglycosylase RlpA family protein [Xanthobacter sp. AM11]|uniref:septal ring lytic transglycosylase RlpA family protein n=1 Tax=Xanthobacter sp. AM11 TaxID=3380643 RepID=UPI0039BF5433